MGFSAAGSLGSHISIRDTHDGRINSQFFIRSITQQNTISFKFSEPRPIQGSRIFISKQEPIEFVERRSPNEVLHFPIVNPEPLLVQMENVELTWKF